MHRHLVRLAALAAIVLVPATALAQRSPADSPPPPASDSLAAESDLPSPFEATGMSVGATLLPPAAGVLLLAAGWDRAYSPATALGLAAIGGGAILGPWAGYAYGGIGRRGAGGVLARVLLVGALPLAGGSRGGDGLMLIGGALAVSALWDVTQVGGLVDRHNQELAGVSRLELAPCTTAGGRSPALALRLRLGGPAR